MLRKIEKDKKDIENYINSIKLHLSKNEFSEAQGLVTIFRNINSYCPEVQSIEKEFHEKMKHYEGEVKKRFSAIDSAINSKDYDRAYELIKKVRNEILLSYRDRVTLDEKERNVKNLIQQKNSTRESLKQVENFYKAAVELKKEADRLTSEAERELNHDLAISKLSEALQTLENAQKTYPLLQPQEFSNRIGRLQGLLRLRQAQKASEEAQRIANAGKVNQAISLLEGALQELNKYPYSQFITYEERRPILEQIESLKAKVAEAQRLRIQAQTQEKAGNIEEAIRLYEESLKLVFDENIVTQVNKLKERKSIADSLWQECTELARLNSLVKQ